MLLILGIILCLENFLVDFFDIGVILQGDI